MDVCIICEDIIEEEKEKTKLTLKDCAKINRVSTACGVNMVANVGDKVSKIFFVFEYKYFNPALRYAKHGR